MTFMAKPNLNGNTEQHFYEAYMKLREAEVAIQRAAEAMSANVLHGRNYTHLDDAEDQLVIDRRFTHECLSNAKAEIGMVMSCLADALETS